MTDRLISERLKKTPEGFSRTDVQLAVIPVLTAITSYHNYLEQSRQVQKLVCRNQTPSVFLTGFYDKFYASIYKTTLDYVGIIRLEPGCLSSHAANNRMYSALGRNNMVLLSVPEEAGHKTHFLAVNDQISLIIYQTDFTFAFYYYYYSYLNTIHARTHH